MTLNWTEQVYQITKEKREKISVTGSPVHIKNSNPRLQNFDPPAQSPGETGKILQHKSNDF